MFFSIKQKKLFAYMILFWAILAWIRLDFPITQAKSYDLYVEKQAKSDGDGSQEKPFNSISKAIKYAQDQKIEPEIFIRKGDYSESIVLPREFELYGQDQNGVVISGSVVLEHDTQIQDLTVQSALKTITIKSDADATIINCTIQNFSHIGINAQAGDGKLEVKESKIINGRGKGLYIQRGKDINLSNNLVHSNQEEGIDIRSNVNGKIQNNVIKDNRESGIELIVGSADLRITGNDIEDNGSSGIAAQFYEDFDKKGDVLVANNLIVENHKYGFDCNRPHGGSAGSGYWDDSIELRDNEFKKNKQKSINNYCNLIQAVDEDEQKDNTIVEVDSQDKQTQADQNQESDQANQGQAIDSDQKHENENDQAKMEQKINQGRIEESKKIKQVKSILNKADQINQEINNQNRLLIEQPKFNQFFLGQDLDKIKIVKKHIKTNQALLEQTNFLISDIVLEPEEDIMLRQALHQQEQSLDQSKKTLAQYQQRLTLGGLLNNSPVIQLIIIIIIFSVFGYLIFKKKLRFKKNH
ncbi:MAG: hypothetical protein GF332_04135 [Candidatus Moranbacteria bacterium]|nr:hypothetical protein [Candidatus Moranbacteria bacterium]